jgi:hypothetical protein
MKSLEGARSGLARRQLGVPHGPLRGESDRRNHIRWSAAKINELVQIVQAVQWFDTLTMSGGSNFRSS